MPELPDVELYLHALRSRVAGRRLEGIRFQSPFLLRSAVPPIEAAHGRILRGLSRLGKRIVFELEGDLFLVLHLMIAGRLRWVPVGAKIPGRLGLAAFDFDNGTLLLTEAGSKKRASLYLVAGEEGLRAHDPGGLDLLSASLKEFADRLAETNHTLKRSLTDPRIFSGIGNAYSDEILHRARLSPFKQTRRLSEEETRRLFEASCDILREWTQRLREETGEDFPAKVTAFRPQMAVHGRYRKPCPRCGTPVQRIVYASNEANYCPACQTAGKLLADRALSQLLREDWPRTLEELEARRRG